MKNNITHAYSVVVVNCVSKELFKNVCFGILMYNKIHPQITVPICLSEVAMCVTMGLHSKVVTSL